MIDDQLAKKLMVNWNFILERIPLRQTYDINDIYMNYAVFTKGNALGLSFVLPDTESNLEAAAKIKAIIYI